MLKMDVKDKKVKVKEENRVLYKNYVDILGGGIESLMGGDVGEKGEDEDNVYK
jgi:hypothetical protein